MCTMKLHFHLIFCKKEEKQQIAPKLLRQDEGMKKNNQNTKTICVKNAFHLIEHYYRIKKSYLSSCFLRAIFCLIWNLSQAK